MKTLSGRFAFKLALLTAIAIVAALAFRAFATATPTPTPAQQKFTLYIGEYAGVPDAEQDAFKKALEKLKKNGGQCELTFLRKEGEQPIKGYCDNLSLKTDKVTKSELASSAAAGESAANDPNLTYRVSSNDATDFKDVVKMFSK
jgi:hypothetical protein